MSLIGQQLGPFLIEKEVGSGAMGAVYRGVYKKTGQKVAIKVMLPGAADNEQAQRRFDREAAILKQFNHRNIVRFLGAGRHQGMRYYAMEYIEGESLDCKLTRQGRLTWEEVVGLGRQLCSALQHAHEQGVIHRDLKPSNLMLLPNDTLKLTDFGIAKDLDVTQLTSANCTVGTASYMSPEQCKGERCLTHKSDLYSLGIVLYELVTGKKPFVAENVMDMFLAHVQGKCEKPSRLVLDLPGGFDVLIMQLLEKKPEQRPRDASTVANALTEVMEKFEARQSAGLEAARARTIDRPRGDRPDDADKDAARTLLAGKKKKKKKIARAPFYQKVWFKAAGLLGGLIAVAAVVYLLTRPPSPDKLFAHAERLMTSKDESLWKTAHNGPIREYLQRYGDRDDEKTRRIKEWDNQVGVYLAEKELAALKQKVKVIDVSKMDALSEAGKLAIKASQEEDEGNLDEATRIWKEIAREHADEAGYWDELGQRRITQYAEVQARLPALEEHFRVIDRRGDEPRITDETERRAFTARRYERFGDLFEAYRRWTSLKEDLQGKPEMRTWFLLAASKAREVRGRQPTGVKDETEARLSQVKRKLAEAGKPGIKVIEARAILLDLLALYRKEEQKEFKELVADARKLLKQIDPDAKVD